MKMAKPSERDIDAAGDLLSLLLQIDRGDYPNLDEKDDVPDYFDEDNYEHLRAFYDAVKATLDKGPGYPGRVIGGMCYVIMWDKNEIVDPDSDTIDLHPKLVKALEAADASAQAAQADARDAALEEAISVIPGGSVCDPQQVADAIRALKRPADDSQPAVGGA
jgi:hypothetical protein